MRSSARAIFAALLLLSLKSCSLGPMLHVFNATGLPISFAVGDRRYTAASGGTTEFHMLVPITAEARGCEFAYLAPLPPPEYVGGRFFRRHIYAQIDGDERLFVLRPSDWDESAADVVVSSQPDGYPVTPSVECG